MTSSSRLSVGFILTPKFTLSAFANFIDVLRLAGDESDRSRQRLCSWDILSENSQPIQSSCGVSVTPTQGLGDPSHYDYLCVVGGLLDELPKLRSAHAEYLRYGAVKNTALIGICTGAFVLHQLGLMDGHRCCVSWFHRNDFLEQFEGLKPVSNEIFVPDGARLTCSGGVASAHLAAYLVKRHIGATAAEKALRIMQIDHAAEPRSPQPAAPAIFQPSHPSLQRLLLAMAQDMDGETSISALAKAENMGRRHLERRFKRHLGLSPQRALLMLRLNVARNHLRLQHLSIGQIALECGFFDAAHFARLFKREHGITPSQFRNGEKPTKSVDMIDLSRHFQ